MNIHSIKNNLILVSISLLLACFVNVAMLARGYSEEIAYATAYLASIQIYLGFLMIATKTKEPLPVVVTKSNNHNR